MFMEESFSSATTQQNLSFAELNHTEIHFPPEFQKISESTKICVILYAIVFLFAFTGNCCILRSLWRRPSNTQTRVRLLLIHLSLADILVCFTVIPTEVFWRLTIQWKGGTIICKVAQFSRAFALYLSSFVLICISVDRYIAIRFPLRSIPRLVFTRVRLMLSAAWTLAALCAVPQLIFFSVQTHPDFPQFEQCVTDYINTPLEIQLYTTFSVITLYIIPLLITLLTCLAVSCKLYMKSRRRQSQNTISVELISMDTNSTGGARLHSSLTSSQNISRAANRTFFMTVVIVAAFVCCWTPYSVMTLWYLVDWDDAVKVDPLVQDICFLMAVTNSCINPIVYGIFNQSWR